MPFEIVPPGTHIDFIGKRKIAFALICRPTAGRLELRRFRSKGVPKLGIDFAGGTEVQLRFAPMCRSTWATARSARRSPRRAAFRGDFGGSLRRGEAAPSS